MKTLTIFNGDDTLELSKPELFALIGQDPSKLFDLFTATCVYRDTIKQAMVKNKEHWLKDSFDEISIGYNYLVEMMIQLLGEDTALDIIAKVYHEIAIENVESAQ